MSESDLLAETLRSLYSDEQYAQIVSCIRREDADIIKYLDLESRKLGYNLERYNRASGPLEPGSGLGAEQLAAPDISADQRFILMLRGQLLEKLENTYQRQLREAARDKEEALRARLEPHYAALYAQRIKRRINRLLAETVGAVLLVVGAARGITLVFSEPSTPAPQMITDPQQPASDAARGELSVYPHADGAGAA